MSGVGTSPAAAAAGQTSLSTPLRMIVGHDGGSGGDDAIALARMLAAGGEAEAIVALVVPLGPREIGDPPIRRPERARTWKELCEGLREAGAKALREREVVGGPPDGLEENGTVLLDDSAARALSGLAEAERPDVLVIGSTHRGKLGRIWPGTTADRLLNGCARPVAQAPRGYASAVPHAPERVGVGFDGSPESTQALALATELAVRHGATLQIIGAVSPTGWADREIVAEAFDVLGGEGLHDRRAEALNDLAEAASRSARDRGLKVRIDIAHGDPSELLQTATRGAVDLLVVGSRRYGPVGSVLLGSVSSRVICGAAAPVLVATR